MNDERESYCTLPTHEIFEDLLVSVSSVMDEDLIADLITDACCSLYYKGETENIVKYSGQLYERFLESKMQEYNNKAYANDCATKIARAWLEFTLALREMYLSYGLYENDEAVYHYVTEVDGDIVLQCTD